MRLGIGTALAGAPSLAAAHATAGASHWWTTDPWIWVPMLLAALLYLRGAALLRMKHTLAPHALPCFAAGMAALFFALIWPLDALGDFSFAAHMAQHMLLIAVAAPLLALADAGVPMSVALPAASRRIIVRLARGWRRLQRPGVAFAVHGAVVWFWHAPLAFSWAAQSNWVHVLEHATFFGSALLFWGALRQAGRAGGDGYGAAAVWTLATLMHTGLLGALLTFAPRLLYPTYANAGNPFLTPLEDQQLAGLLMWIPAGLCYLVAGLGYAAAWLRTGERGQRKARAGAPPEPP